LIAEAPGMEAQADITVLVDIDCYTGRTWKEQMPTARSMEQQQQASRMPYNKRYRLTGINPTKTSHNPM
jgi:hypothetical protein